MAGTDLRNAVVSPSPGGYAAAFSLKGEGHILPFAVFLVLLCGAFPARGGSQGFGCATAHNLAIMTAPDSAAERAKETPRASARRDMVFERYFKGAEARALPSRAAPASAEAVSR